MSIFNINKLKEEENFLRDSIEKLKKDENTIQDEIKKLNEKKNIVRLEINNLANEKNKLNVEIKNRQDFIIRAEYKYMDNLSGLEFEEYCTELLRKNGFEAIKTKATGDDGGDVLASKDGITYVIQCKHYVDTVGNKAVQEVYTAKGIYKTQKAIVMTNSFFTDQAIKEADILEIQLWDRLSIQKLISAAYEFDILNLDTVKSNDCGEEIEDDGTDELLEEAINYVIQYQEASATFLQTKLKIGYSRSRRILDQLEERGIISGYQGSKPRTVLITPERWEELNAGTDK